MTLPFTSPGNFGKDKALACRGGKRAQKKTRRKLWNRLPGGLRWAAPTAAAPAAKSRLARRNCALVTPRRGDYAGGSHGLTGGLVDRLIGELVN